MPWLQTRCTFPKTRLGLQTLTTPALLVNMWSNLFAVIIWKLLLTLPRNRVTACLTLLRKPQHRFVRTVGPADPVRTDPGWATLILGSRVAFLYSVVVVAWTLAATSLETIDVLVAMQPNAAVALKLVIRTGLLHLQHVFV